MSTNKVHEWTRRGTALLRRGKQKQALEWLEKAHERDPDDFDAALNLSAAYIMGKKFKQAVPILEQLAQRDGENAMIWTNLGAAYLGNPVLADEARQANAVRAFTQALSIDPQAPNVAYNIGLIHKDRKEFAIARRWFGIALQTDANDKDAAYWLAQMEKQDDE